MSRPETIADIEIDPIEFATIDLSLIASDGTMTKAYGAFLEAVQRAGASVDIRYSTTAKLTRPPTTAEQNSQLSTAQSTWDAAQKDYETLREVGELEHKYRLGTVQKWAEAEGLPFPPEHEPIDSFDAVIRDIDQVVGA